MFMKQGKMRLAAFATVTALSLSAAAQGSDDDKSADEEIEELIGPTYAETMTVTGTRNRSA